MVADRFVSKAAFMVPQWQIASGCLEHGPFAFWLIEQLRPRLVVELGTYAGFSFGCFCQAMKEFDVDGRAIAVDSWEGDVHAGFFKHKGQRYYDNLSAHVNTHYSAFAELKRMYFADALAHVDDGSVDLLHVDGRHFYDDVKEDHMSWIRKLSDRAIVLFHDTQVRDRGFGVHQYWSEVRSGRPSFEFVHGHGWGVLQHGDNVPESLAALMSDQLAESERSDVRLVYSTLGRGVNDRYERGRLAEKLRDYKNPVRKIVKEIRRPFA